MKKSIRFKIIFLLFFSVPSLFANTFQQALDLEKKGKISEALKVCYDILAEKHETPDDAVLKIFELETDAASVLDAVDSCSERIFAKEKIYKMAASLALMSGFFGRAQRYYETVYSLNPLRRNFDSLYISAVLLYEAGEFDAASERFTLISENDSGMWRERSSVMKSAVLISKKEKEKGTDILNRYLSESGCHENTLLLIYDIASAFSLNDIKERASEALKKRGFGGRLVSKGDFLPATPSRIFLSGADEERSAASAENATPDSPESEEMPEYIQAGMFSNIANAEHLAEKILALGFNPEIELSLSGERSFYKVRIKVKKGMDINLTVITLKESNIESFLVF